MSATQSSSTRRKTGRTKQRHFDRSKRSASRFASLLGSWYQKVEVVDVEHGENGDASLCVDGTLVCVEFVEYQFDRERTAFERAFPELKNSLRQAMHSSGLTKHTLFICLADNVTVQSKQIKLANGHRMDHSRFAEAVVKEAMSLQVSNFRSVKVRYVASVSPHCRDGTVFFPVSQDGPLRACRSIELADNTFGNHVHIAGEACGFHALDVDHIERVIREKLKKIPKYRQENMPVWIVLHASGGVGLSTYLHAGDMAKAEEIIVNLISSSSEQPDMFWLARNFEVNSAKTGETLGMLSRVWPTS